MREEILDLTLRIPQQILKICDDQRIATIKSVILIVLGQCSYDFSRLTIHQQSIYLAFIGICSNP